MNTDKVQAKSKGVDNLDKNMDTQEQTKDRMKRFNPIDGLWHNDNGTVTDVDGTPVSVNVQLEASKKTKVHHHHKK